MRTICLEKEQKKEDFRNILDNKEHLALRNNFAVTKKFLIDLSNRGLISVLSHL